MATIYRVRCEWDAEAGCWVATSDDVPGLATGADKLDELVTKLRLVVPELLAANGVLPPDGDTIALDILAERRETIPAAA